MLEPLPEPPLHARAEPPMLTSAGLILFAKVVVPAASFAIVYVLGLTRGVEPVGQFNTAMAVLSLFQIFGGLGLDSYLTRETAQDPRTARDLFLRTARLVLAVSLVSMAAAVALTLLIGYDRTIVLATAVGSLSLAPFALLPLLDAVFIGLHRPRTVARVALGENVIRLCLSLLVIWLRPHVVLLLLAHSLGKAAGLLFYWIPLGKLPRARSRLESASALFRTVLPFVGILLCYAVFWRLDVLLLSRLRGYHDAGLYSMGQKVVMVFYLVPASLVLATLPKLAAAFISDRDAFGALYRRTLSWLCFYVIPITIILVFRGQDLFALLGLGDRWTSSGKAVTILALLIPLMSFIEVSFRTMLAAGLERSALGVALRSALACMIILTPATYRYGWVGTAWAVVGAAAFDLAQDLWYVRRFVSGIAQVCARAALAACALAGLMRLIVDYPLVIFLLVSGAAHLALSCAVGLVKPRDLSNLLMRRRKTEVQLLPRE
ncbi:MAG: oligosaccharide flippase family protein [Acidobacteriota bacterium]